MKLENLIDSNTKKPIEIDEVKLIERYGKNALRLARRQARATGQRAKKAMEEVAKLERPS